MKYSAVITIRRGYTGRDHLAPELQRIASEYALGRTYSTASAARRGGHRAVARICRLCPLYAGMAIAADVSATPMNKHTKYTYNPTTDSLYADGKYVGGASDLTRDMMLATLACPEEWADATDEALFDAVVVSATSN